jgi:hypothetical protein
MAIKPARRTPDQRSVVGTTISSAVDGFSEVIDCGGLVPTAIEFSTAWTAAGVGFHVGRSSDSLSPLFHGTSGGFLSSTGSTPMPFRISSDSINTSTASILSFSPIEQLKLGAFRYMRLISNDTDGGAVAQSTPRTLYVYLGIPQGPIK